MGKNKIPGGFLTGFAIEVKSNQEILLIGETGSDSDRILSFHVKTHQFERWGYTSLISGRSDIACAFIPGTTDKILVTGKNSIIFCQSAN